MLLVGALGSTSCEGPPAVLAPGSDVSAFKNFTLFDGTDRQPMTPAAMLITDGRISWVGPSADLSAPAGVVPTDLSGRFVMPGLINLHAHLGNTVDLTQNKDLYTRDTVQKDLRTHAAYGVTTVLSMGTDQDAIFAIRDEQRAGRPTSARVYTAGQGVVFAGGYGGLPNLNKPVASVADAQRAVDEQAAKRVDIIKFWLDDELGTMPKMPAEISKAIIDAAHRHGLRAVAHIFYLADAKRLVDQGIDGLVHGVRDAPLDAAIIERMKQQGTWQVAATLSREASMFAYGAPSPLFDDPFFTRAVSPAALDLLKSPERQKTVSSNPNFTRYPAFFETAKSNLKMQADAGIPYGFGSDTGPPGRFPGYFEHWELALMVEAGLTQRQTLTAATRRAAEFLRATDLGTLEPGKWADFIVLGADPLADINNTRTIRTVYIAGRPLPAGSGATR